MTLTEFAIAVAIVILAGLVRGTTGFGGAMVMTPPLSLLWGPYDAIVIALLLEVIGAAQLLRSALENVRWRSIVPILAPALAMIPAGVALLVAIDSALARRLIAGVVVFFSSLMLAGIRYQGQQRLTTSVALGILSGVLLGVTSIGAPPVIVYLLAGPDPAATTRANLIIYVTTMSLGGLVVLGFKDIVTVELLARTLLLAPFLLGATWAGHRLFGLLSEQLFRRLALGFLLAASLVILVI